MNELEKHFHPTWGGKFLARDGAGHTGDGTYSQKKLCFTATDKQFLVQFLYDLSLREECYGVKFSQEPRDGMYLGRCYVVEDATAGAWWKEYKPHDKMMCNLQDDEFIANFRDWEKINAEREKLKSTPPASPE